MTVVKVVLIRLFLGLCSRGLPSGAVWSSNQHEVEALEGAERSLARPNLDEDQRTRVHPRASPFCL